MLLEIKDLKVHYGRAETLKAISINLAEGSVISIVGANGAGKTTILRTISGLKRPTSGEIRFQGNRIDGLPAHAIVRLGIVQIPEGGMIFAPMTVLANLKMGAYLRRDKAQVTKDLDSVYQLFPILKERSGQRAGTLSGGEQRMLAISRALMASPKLLLMDEPSMGLAPMLVEEIGKTIKDIERSAFSILLVEQNTRMAFGLSNKAYVLELGSIILEGDPKELANDERVRKIYLGG